MELVKKYVSWLLFMLLMIPACKEDDMGNVKNVASVSDVSFVQANGSLLFSWKNPQMTDMAYVEISYIDKKGEKRRVLVKDGQTQQWIDGIEDTQFYDFRFVVYDVNGNVSEPVEVLAAALEPTVNLFQGRVGVKTVIKGVEVSWDNDFDETFFIRISYTDLNGGHFKHEVPAPEHSSGKVVVPIGAKITGTQTLMLDVQVVDVNDNVSESRVIAFHKLNAGRLKRDKWIVVPSSEETSAENGKAENVIDGDVKTYWHSRYSKNKEHYPHSLVIDLGAVYRLQKIGLQHRQTEAMAKGIKVYGSNRLAAANDKAAWTIFGAVEMVGKDVKDELVKGEQMFDFPAPVDFRYVKIEFFEPGDGDKHCAALAELNLYGAELE